MGGRRFSLRSWTRQGNCLYCNARKEKSPTEFAFYDSTTRLNEKEQNGYSTLRLRKKIGPCDRAQLFVLALNGTSGLLRWIPPISHKTANNRASRMLSHPTLNLPLPDSTESCHAVDTRPRAPTLDLWTASLSTNLHTPHDPSQLR